MKLRQRIPQRHLDPERSKPWRPSLSHDRTEKVAPGAIVPMEIEILPSSALFEAGELLRLVISGRDIMEFTRFGHDEMVNKGRHQIYAEIPRLEPVVGMLYRKPAEDAAAPIAIDIRGLTAMSLRSASVPTPSTRTATAPSGCGRTGLDFGDSEHRCPGAGVALEEAEILLERLLRVPGIRLTRVPDIGWNGLIAGYEPRDAVLNCD